MPLSYQEQSIGAGTTSITLSIQYLDKSHLQFYLNSNLITPTSVVGSTVVFSPAIGPGLLRVERFTPRTEVPNVFSNQAEFGERTIDENFQWALLCEQETSERSVISAISADTISPGTSGTLTLVGLANGTVPSTALSVPTVEDTALTDDTHVPTTNSVFKFLKLSRLASYIFSTAQSVFNGVTCTLTEALTTLSNRITVNADLAASANTAAQAASASVGALTSKITVGSNGVEQIKYNNLGSLTVTPGNTTQGPGGGAYDGGILTHKPTGDYQVSAYQVHPTPGLVPSWGPISEFVVARTHDQATNLQRWSFTAMAEWAGPNPTDQARDYRLQQEASGTQPILDTKITSQHNSTGWLVEYLDFLAGGSIQAFRRTDSPAPSGDALEFILEQERRTTAPVLTSAGVQNSPALRFTGKGYDSSLHDADWKLFASMYSTAGGSNLRVQTRKDSSSYTTLLDLADTGVLGVYGSIALGSTNTGTGSSKVINATNGGAFGTVAIDSASFRVADKAPGAAAWKARGENGFEGWLMLLNDSFGIGSDTTGSKVFSSSGAALGPNAGWIVTEGKTGQIQYIPYWTSV